MTRQTELALNRVRDLMKEAREILDLRMYGRGDTPEEDERYCRMVYESICRTMDLL